MRDWLPMLVATGLAIAVFVAILWLLGRADDEKRAECRKVGGVVAPSSWGWNCQLPRQRPEVTP